jgi:hypothetical protein
MPDYQYSVELKIEAKANIRSDLLRYKTKIMLHDVMSRGLKDSNGFGNGCRTLLNISWPQRGMAVRLRREIVLPWPIKC